MRRDNPLAAALLGGALSFAIVAAASAYPTGTVKIVVPFPPGGPTDLLTRLVGQRLQESWGQPVLVEYKPGAGTLIGTDAVAKAPPDGHTIGVVVSNHTINPSLRRSMPFDTVKDLAAVTQLTRMPLVLVAYPSAPFNTLPELVAYARRNPGRLSFATPGAGGTSHLAGELLNNRAGLTLVHVPYKGSAPAQTDLMGARVDLMFDPFFSAYPFVKAGKMKVIALTAERRLAGYSEYPVIAEFYPGFNVTAMLGFVVPAATPRAIVKQIQADTAKALREPEVNKRVLDLGLDIVASTPEDFDAFIRAEIGKWTKVVREAGIPFEN